MVFGLLPLPPPLPFLALRASCSSPAAGFALQGRGWFGGRLVVRLSVWIVCLVVAPWVVVCKNGNGGWIAASTPSPTLPRCGLRPAGEGVVRRGMLSGCRFGLCVWSLLRRLFAAPTPALPHGGGGGLAGVCCPVVGLDCVFGRCSVGCGVQKRQWRLDCCLYPLPDPPPLRASPCGGGSGSVVGLGLRAVTGFALTAPTFVGLRASR